MKIPDCYEYLNLNYPETECPIYGRQDALCWTLATTEHTHPFILSLIEKGIIPSVDEK